MEKLKELVETRVRYSTDSTLFQLPTNWKLGLGRKKRKRKKQITFFLPLQLEEEKYFPKTESGREERGHLKMTEIRQKGRKKKKRKCNPTHSSWKYEKERERTEMWCPIEWKRTQRTVKSFCFYWLLPSLPDYVIREMIGSPLRSKWIPSPPGEIDCFGWVQGTHYRGVIAGEYPPKNTWSFSCKSFTGALLFLQSNELLTKCLFNFGEENAPSNFISL